MLSDGLTSLQADGKARDEVEVLDVAQMLLAAVKREPDPEAVAAEPAAGDDTQTDETVTETQDVGADAAAHEEPDPEAESGADPAEGEQMSEQQPSSQRSPVVRRTRRRRPRPRTSPATSPSPASTTRTRHSPAPRPPGGDVSVEARRARSRRADTKIGNDTVGRSRSARSASA